MIRHLDLDLYSAEFYLVTRPVDFDRVCEQLAPGDHVAPWSSVGRVQTFHQGDGTDGAPIFVAVIAIDERVMRDEPTPYAVRTIAHETTHAAALLMDHIGQPYDGVSEALAYLTGYLAEWIWAQLPPRITGKRAPRS